MRKGKYAFLALLMFLLTLFLSGCGLFNQSPNASLSATPTNGYVTLDVTFDASSSSDSDGSIVNYDWDFADDSTDSGQTVTHTFNSARNYTVELTVTDNGGATDSAYTTISVDVCEFDYCVTPDEITDEFYSNEIAAKDKYEGATIVVTGIVGDINDSDLFTGPNVSLGEDWCDVTCYFSKSDEEELMELQKGDHVTIAGDFDFYSGGLACSVFLDNSQVIDSSA